MRQTLVIAITALLPPIATDAASLAVLRDELQVNQFITDSQDHATVTINQAGISLMTWNSDGDISARLFDAVGQPLSDEFLINEITVGDQRTPDVARNLGDFFVVVWSSGTPALGYDVSSKILSASGTVLLIETKVNESPSEIKSEPDVAMYNNGDLLVVWNEWVQGNMNFYIRLFNSAGNPLTAPVIINDVPVQIPDPNRPYGLPDIAVNETGLAFAAWERVTDTGIIIAGRTFNPYTLLFNNEFVVAPVSAGIDQRRPMVDINEAGDNLITWAEGPAGSVRGDIYVMKYYASTSEWGTKIRPDTIRLGNQHRCVGKLTTEGRFTVAWTAGISSDPFSDDVFVRFYNVAGSSLSPTIKVNSTASDEQRRPAIALAEYPDHILMTISWESFGQDGDNFGVFNKLYGINY